jgi:chemotaxis signal transduction protein
MNNYFDMYNRKSLTQIPFLEQMTDQEFWDYAQSLATQQNAPATSSADALECQTEQGRYLLPLRAVREVVSPPHKLTLLPFCPPWMLGITAWQGHVIPVVDLASYFIMHKTNKLDTTQHTHLSSNSMLLILDDTNSLLGILLAAIGSIITLEQTQLGSPDLAPSWYPQRLITTLLGVYNGSAILNPPVLITELTQQIKANTAL